ncbi:MAG: spore coat associated protein CotJA [Bacillota bacterium]
MNGPNRKPLVWTWPPGRRNGAPASDDMTIKADLTVETGQEQPAEEKVPSEINAGLDPADTVPAQAAEADVAEEVTDQNDAVTVAEPPENTSGDYAEPAAATPLDELQKVKSMDHGSSTEEERVPSPPETKHPPEIPGPVLPSMELARAYVPYQRYGPTYLPREALEKGTLFPDLYRPYLY